MNRFNAIHANRTLIKPFISKGLGIFAATLIAILIPLSSCTDDLLPSENNTVNIGNGLTLVDLPGVFGITISQNDQQNTRAENNTTPSAGGTFNDGNRNEYAFADPDESKAEYLHYLVMYDKNSNDAKPWIFPIDKSSIKLDNVSPNNNITLTVSKVFMAKDDNGQLNSSNTSAGFAALESQSALASFINGLDVYALINFKMDENNHSVGANGVTTGINTVARLSALKKVDFLNLRLNDYKIYGTETVTNLDGSITKRSGNFFTMSNSTYSDGTNRVIDMHVNSSNIFPDEESAKQAPAVVCHVERLASKIEVDFNISKMKMADFDPYGNQSIKDQNVKNDPVTGLPVIELTVQKVNMNSESGTGIRFDQTGYQILTDDVDATIRILGFGLSNLEKQENLFKDLNPLLSETAAGWKWNDATDNHRSYWGRDLHYEISKAEKFHYPHQFRLALDADSVNSHHVGLSGGYLDYNDYEEKYKIGDDTYTAYKKLGKINTEAINPSSYLKYKSFNTLMDDYSSVIHRATTVNGVTSYSFDPVYCLENTYFDPGTLGGGNTWVWPWYREPYALATNLIVMAEIEIADNASTEYDQSNPGSDGASESLSTREEAGNSGSAATESGPKTVYLGQNNIFYLRKVNLLKSKLAILNTVMLEGGNAGIQILHGQWDHHIRWSENDEDQHNNTHLDKVAWNENSKLWFAEVMTKKDDNGEDLKDEKGNLLLEYEPKEGTDADGNTITYNKVKLEKTWQAVVYNDQNADENDQDLDLIPAEISGGDGQCLIAPNQKYMGAKFRYFLAPEKAENTTVTDEVTGENKVVTTYVMDEDLAVEISYNHLVALIHKIIGPVDVYRNGKMYYSVPIPHHLSNYGPSSKTDWSEFGRFSNVRNNWYHITVNEITRLGTPIDDLDQPIVPVMDVKRSYLNMGVDVKEWHEVVQDNIPIM